MAKAKGLTSDEALVRLRAACYAMPAVEEKLSHGAPCFFVRGKMFASFASDHHGDGRTATWVKADKDRQSELVADEPGRYFVPPYVGVKGWVGVHLGVQTDWETLSILIEEAWTSVAPKSAHEAPVLPPPKVAARPKTDPALSARVFDRLLAVCQALAGSECERETWSATFRAKKKPFAYFNDNHHGDGIIGVWVRVDPPGDNAVLAAASPERYFVPPYLGPRGWVGLRLDTKDVDWDEVAARVAASHASVVGPAKKPTRGPSSSGGAGRSGSRSVDTAPAPSRSRRAR
jgi:hypothetical protein